MRVAVLGAGLQGICAALAVRERGHDVILVEQDHEPMNRASLRNEGKIHLGFIYANDPSLRTSQLMLSSAVEFAPLLDRWLPGCFDWSTLRSRPFLYLVMRDSLLDPEALCAHYERIARCIARESGFTHYLGNPLRTIWRRIRMPSFVNPDRVVAAVETEEVAIDVNAFGRAIRAGLDTLPGIERRCGWRVEAVQRCASGFAVRATDAGGATHQIDADAVVNCLWESRLAIDEQLGIVSTRPHAYRLKYRLMAELPPPLRALPALSLVLGQYGDVVPWAGSSYMSWYPVCRRGWSDALRPPADWAAPCRGDVSPDVAADVASKTLAALDDVIPGIAAARVSSVDAGTIVAWGDQDIHKRDSELHERHDVGVHAHDGYFSIDTGKLTCAPYFAECLARRL